MHVDLYKAKARVIGMRSSSPARVRARIGILSRANHVTSALRIGEQSESPGPAMAGDFRFWAQFIRKSVNHRVMQFHFNPLRLYLELQK